MAVVSPAQAYRTAGDLPDFEGTEQVRWQQPTIRYRLFDWVPGNFQFAEVEQATREAFASWGEPDCSQVSFSYQGSTLAGAEPGDQVSTVQFIHSGWADRGFDPTAGGITDVQYENRDGAWVIVEADLYINADSFDWVLGEPTMSGQRDLRSVLVHEAGHMLGLLHPCEPGGEEGAPRCDTSHSDIAMFPLYGAANVSLSEDDEAGVCFLYPGQSCEVVGCPGGSECTEDGCRAVCGDVLCGRDEVCIAGTCALPDDACSIIDCGGCEETADCASDLVCVEGSCVPGSGYPGDPCASGRDCDSTVCHEDGHCLQACIRDTDCGRDACVDFVCSGERQAMGARCSESNECLGDECLAGDRDNPVCTRRCDIGFPDCPRGWRCGRVEDRNVCRPEQEVAGCGCSVPGSKRRLNPLGALGGGLFGLFLAFRVAQRRRSSRERKLTLEGMEA